MPHNLVLIYVVTMKDSSILNWTAQYCPSVIYLSNIVVMTIIIIVIGYYGIDPVNIIEILINAHQNQYYFDLDYT